MQCVLEGDAKHRLLGVLRAQSRHTDLHPPLGLFWLSTTPGGRFLLGLHILDRESVNFQHLTFEMCQTPSADDE